MVDLRGRQVLVLLAHPPIHEADEGSHQETDDGFELERIELAPRVEARKLGVGEPLEPLRRLATSKRTALAARDRLEQPLPGTEVAEQLQRPAERGVIRLPAARVGAGDIEVGEDRHEEIVLVDEVRVEGRTPHVRAIDDVLDGHTLVALFEDEVGKGLLQRLPRLGHAPIRPAPPVITSDRHWCHLLPGRWPRERSATNIRGLIVG